MEEEKRWISFDPTIHAGHLLIVLGAVSTGIVNYCAVENDIRNLNNENTARKQEISDIKNKNEEQLKNADAKFERLVDAQNKQVSDLRNDMKEWFMSLDHKLDQKADRK
jgi:hypothetical protein